MTRRPPPTDDPEGAARRRSTAWTSAGRLAALGATAVLVTAMVGEAIVGDAPPATTATGSTEAATPEPGAGELVPGQSAPGEPAPWVVAGEEGTPVRADAGGDVQEVAAAGLTWPILDEVDGGYLVATHCDVDAWVDADDVVRPDVARGPGMAGAVVVLDAGHGGVDAGAIGPNDLYEADLNLAVAERLQAMLERGNDIDPDTGAVVPGDDVPPVAAVLMTRDAQDGTQGYQRTSLGFRGDLAASAGADALLSIHHNSGSTEVFDEPPTEVYYSVDDEASPRLAGFVLEELRRSLAPLETVWGGRTLRGTIGRSDPDGTDYFTVLQHSEGAAVITEAMYISGPRGAALAATEEFQQAEAEAFYRALVRFLGTDEPGPDVNGVTVYDVGDEEPYDYAGCSLAGDEDPAS